MTVERWFKKRLFVSVALAAAAIASPATAVVPAGVTQQGRLLDSEGAPVNGELTFEFTIYDAASAGTALWTESQAITLDEGFFSTRLGETEAFPADLFGGGALFLGVTVGTDAEMTPRQVMASVPYAHTAANVNGAITPASVTVNGIEIVNAAGEVPASVITGFSGLFSVVTAAGTSGITSTATANCPVGGVATGGGCAISATSGDGNVIVKQNEPSMSGPTPTGWACGCQDADGSTNPTCTIEASVVCLSEGG
jgi:hypothetical protein